MTGYADIHGNFIGLIRKQFVKAFFQRLTDFNGWN